MGANHEALHNSDSAIAVSSQPVSHLIHGRDAHHAPSGRCSGSWDGWGRTAAAPQLD